MRAFRRTLEDIEEIRSTRSFQSLHSTRSLRGSHMAQHHRPLSDDICHYRSTAVSGRGDWNGSRLREQNGSYTNMAMCVHDGQADNVCKLSNRSRSADNVSVTDAAGTTLPCAAMPTGGVPLSVSPHNRSSPNMRLHETSM